jgi:hypothetical protein
VDYRTDKLMFPDEKSMIEMLTRAEMVLEID